MTAGLGPLCNSVFSLGVGPGKVNGSGARGGGVITFGGAAPPGVRIPNCIPDEPGGGCNGAALAPAVGAPGLGLGTLGTHSD